MAIAYYFTWANYGTWLPGDSRWWLRHECGLQPPDPILELEARARMTEDACLLDDEQRQLVETTIAKHCTVRQWVLHAVNCRTNHVHVVVSAVAEPHIVREQFKAWATRRLKELERSRSGIKPGEERENWWAERGWDELIDDEESLAAVNAYVRDGQ